MIVVAVADDEKKERDILREYFGILQREIREELDVRLYCSGEELLREYDGRWDMVCLDIDMEGEDGVSVAKKIRKTDKNVAILFITNMAQMAIRGYEVQALDFVVKPVSYYSFAMKMKNAISIICNKKSRNIVLTTADGIQKISTDDLYYVEVSGHYLFYHTKDGVFRQKTSLKGLEERLEGLSFKRCNNCYLVNLKYVQCVQKDDLKVGGEWLKISRPRKKDFLQSLTNYMGGLDI